MQKKVLYCCAAKEIKLALKLIATEKHLNPAIVACVALMHLIGITIIYPKMLLFNNFKHIVDRSHHDQAKIMNSIFYHF